MNETGDDISEDESFLEAENPWDAVEKVSYEFLKTGKSKGDGILISHDGNFKVTTLHIKSV